MSWPKDEDWYPPVAFDEMQDPVQAVNNKKDKEELQVNFCSKFGPIRHPDRHKEVGYFWEQYRKCKDMHNFLKTQEYPDGLEREAFCALKRRSSRFHLHNDRLMQRSLPVG